MDLAGCLKSTVPGRNNDEYISPAGGIRKNDRRSRSHKLSAKHPGFLRSSAVAQLVRSVAPFLHRCAPLATCGAQPPVWRGRQNAGKEVHDLGDLRCSARGLDNPNGVLYAGEGTADLFLHITSNYKFTG